MQAFDYVLANSVEQVVSILAQHGEQACILSGGTDLIVQLREGCKRADLLVDVKQLPGLNELRYDPAGGLSIGAAVPCLRISSHPDVITHYPGLLDAVSIIGGVQIQGRASLGGNLCNASPAADSIPALIVHHARALIATPGGPAEMPVEDFCVAPGQTVLKPGEFLISLHLPPPQPGSGAAYLRFIPRYEMDMAVVGVGCSVVLDASGQRFVSARVALAGVAPTPLLAAAAGDALAGKEVSDEAIKQAAGLARDAASPIDDLRGTAAQRRHLVKVLTRRSLQRSIQRARGLTVEKAGR